MGQDKKLFRCTACGYQTHHRGHWRAHTRTAKHQALAKPDACHACERCGKVYKHRQSLYKQRARCNAPAPPNAEATPQATSEAGLLRVIEQLIPRVAQTTNNINVQILLNRECGDAMTIQSFAKSLRMSLEDICQSSGEAKPGMVSNIVSANLGPLRVQDRPLHCTDLDRSKWLVHDERGGWREDTGTTVFRAASFGITKRFQELWDTAHPHWRTDEEQRSSWIDLVACLNADPKEDEVHATLARLAPHCKLTAGQLGEALRIAD